VLFEACQDAPTATVMEVRGQQRLRYAPSPLSTLEFQKRGTQYLRLPGGGAGWVPNMGCAGGGL
jgi:hypothetical protein